MSNDEVENGLISRPSFLPAKRTGGAGTEELAKIIVPPRIKIIQPQAKPPFTDMFDPGDVILTPQMIKLYDKNEGELNFVPIYFFTEYLCLNPWPLKDVLPMVRERTLDPKSELAAKCKDPKRWEELCPENPQGKDYKMRNCEVLNFVVMPIGLEEIGDTPLVMSCSRSSHSAGRNFAALIKMRQADIYGCQFSMQIKMNKTGEWYEPNIHNPSTVSAWVEEEERFEFYKSLHEQYCEANIEVDYADSDLEAAAGEATDTGEF